MGSGISRGTNSTDQRTPSASKRNRNNNSEEDSNISGRTTKRNRTNNHPNPDHTDTTTEVATMSRNDSLESEEDLLTLQNDLEDVERGLNERRGILFTGWSGGGSSQRGGRALFDSIGSALGNIRDRLQDLTGSGSTTPAESTNVAAVSGSISSNSSRSESIRALSQRLSTAELSHSTRMPLNLLQSELSRRDESRDSVRSSTALEAVFEGNASPRSSIGDEDDYVVINTGTTVSRDGNGSRRRFLQRRPSALLASRNRDDLSDAAVRDAATESPTSTSSINLSASSFESGRNLAASVRLGASTAMPTLQESSSFNEEELEEPEISVGKDGVELLLPDSARKLEHLTSMRASMRVLGDDIVRRLDDFDEKESVAGEERTDTEAKVGDVKSEVSSPVVQLYTWGSLEFSDGEKDKENVAYELFGASNIIEKSPSPRVIPRDTRLGRSDIVSMSASETHCAFVTDSGRLLICGSNHHGGVDPSRRDSLRIPRPTHLEAGLAMNRIKKVSCGTNHTAVVTENKSVLTWGCNDNGQLGHRKAKRSNSTSFVYPKAFILGGGRRAVNVACCEGYTLVLTTRMEAFVCGGKDNGGGPFSEFIEEDQYFALPQQDDVLKGLPIVGITSGLRHLVAWTAHGTAYAWGANEAGQCGREYPRELKIPVPIGVPKSSLTPVPDANSNTDSLITRASFLKNWNVWAPDEPMSLASDVHVVDAACGNDHTILVTDSGRLLVCGSNSSGQLGVGVESSSVQPVNHPDPQRKFQCAEAGSNHTVLLDGSGSVWQMGYGESSMQELSSLSKSNTKICSITAGGEVNFAVSKPKSDDTPCAVQPSMPELDALMRAIRLEHEQKKASNISVEKTKSYLSSIEDLARGTENLFRSPAVMNSLFVDPKEIDHMYQTLINGCPNKEMKQRIVSAIEKGMLMGLKSMVDSRLIYFESVRFLLLYLQCPLWREENQNIGIEDEKEESKILFDARGDLLFLLCETILGLPFEGYKAFLAWSATIYGEELFVPLLVKPLVHQLNYRFMNNITHGIPMIAGVLRWFQNVNERCDNALARGQDFYCSGIDDMPVEALFEDLSTYHNASESTRSSNFFLAGHPFLMPPVVKQRLLQVEHQFSMINAAQAGGVSYDAQTREFKFQPYFVLAIDRKYLLQQTLQAVAKASAKDLRKGLKVVFKGEDGVDAGGVTKEFFQLLCEQLFDVNTGMWTTNFGDQNQTWFNPDCVWNGEGYYLVGVLCGLAVYNSVILDVHFPHAIYRKLLGLPLGLEDLIDDDVRKGLKSLLEYEGDDAEYVFCLNFEVTWMALGQERRKELKPGGSDIPVTSENKEEYVRLYVKWLLVDSIETQYDEFERGFNQVMEDSSLHILLAEELELLVTGTPELDFSALEQSSDYEGGFDKDSAVVKNIWKWVQSASLPTQEKFLKFSTGSSKGPIGGLGKMPFKIQRAGPDSQQLPTAHTCFNTLIVPDYGDDYDKLADRLGRAVIECEGFGLQ